MANRYYRFAPHEYYHVYNRGNNKQTIFHRESDYDRFIKLLYACNNDERFVMRELDENSVYATERKKPLVYIGAYCLMPNHFHVLLSPAVDDGIPKFMLKLGTGYASYFNKKYERTGSLFEGPYKARYAESDRYLKYLFSYIHLNPFRGSGNEVKSNLGLKELQNFSYSSLPDYLGIEREQTSVLSPKEFPAYFMNTQEHLSELKEWLDFE
jgi:putative transposase